MEQFSSLPNEAEFVEWMMTTVFKDKQAALEQVLEGFKSLNIDVFKKRFLLTFEEEPQAKLMLDVAEHHGVRGIPWPGLEREVWVKAFSMDQVILEIVLMDVATETDESLVRQTMEKYGRVRRCERLRLPGFGPEGLFGRVKVSKVKVELIRNQEELPNIIHAFGSGHSAEEFQTWKLQYRGCPRYCFGCGAASHEARHCPEQGITREGLEKVRSVVGEEEGAEEGEEVGAPKLSYAAVVKDPSFLERKRLEKQEIADTAAREAREDDIRKEKDAEEEAVLKEDEEGLSRAQRQLQLEKDHIDVDKVQEQVEGTADDKGEGMSTKRPAPAPTSPSPVEKAPRVRQEGETSKDDDEERTTDADGDLMEAVDSEEEGGGTSPSTPVGVSGPPAELGQGVRFAESGYQDGGSQDY